MMLSANDGKREITVSPICRTDSQNLPKFIRRTPATGPQVPMPLPTNRFAADSAQAACVARATFQ